MGKKLAKGNIFIISGPSGAGKTTLYKLVSRKHTDIIFSVSYTTRKPRINEEEGKDYFFISKKEFEDGIKNKRWLEWAEVHGDYYGTCCNFVKKNLAQGCSIFLDIDFCGAEQILEIFPDAVTIFIMPPCESELKLRLEKRGTESGSVIAKRLNNGKKEMKKKDMYKHIIINDKLDKAADRLLEILEK